MKKTKRILVLVLVFALLFQTFSFAGINYQQSQQKHLDSNNDVPIQMKDIKVKDNTASAKFSINRDIIIAKNINIIITEDDNKNVVYEESNYSGHIDDDMDLNTLYNFNIRYIEHGNDLDDKSYEVSYSGTFQFKCKWSEDEPIDMKVSFTNVYRDISPLIELSEDMIPKSYKVKDNNTINEIEPPIDDSKSTNQISTSTDMALAGTKWEVESNNTPSLADRIYDDDDVYGYISRSSDIDYFRITFPSKGEANFWLGSIPSGNDYDLFVYDSDEDLIASSRKGSNSDELISAEPVISGETYYIKVISYSGYSTNDSYYLRAKLYPTSQQPDEYEDNDSFRDATRLTVNPSSSKTIYATIHEEGNPDYFRFTLQDQISDLSISLASIPSGCDYDLELYDEDYDLIKRSAAGSNSSESIDTTVYPGIYYVKAYSYDGESDDEYRLRIRYDATGERHPEGAVWEIDSDYTNNSYYIDRVRYYSHNDIWGISFIKDELDKTSAADVMESISKGLFLYEGASLVAAKFGKTLVLSKYLSGPKVWLIGGMAYLYAYEDEHIEGQFLANVEEAQERGLGMKRVESITYHMGTPVRVIHWSVWDPNSMIYDTYVDDIMDWYHHGSIVEGGPTAAE